MGLRESWWLDVTLGVSVALLGCGRASAPAPPPAAPPATRVGSGEAPAAPKDTSPHRVQFVTVAPDVNVEVLDWGGSGAPVVFLSGLGDVAHVFDDFAPALTDRFHVYGITRRGFGASSQPPTGYDIATRGEDLRRALDALHLDRVSLVGHSIAGDELTWFAGAYPARVERLVYLDAAFDHSHLIPLKSLPWPFPGPVPPPFWPIVDGCGHPDYAKVQAPGLAVYANMPSIENFFPPEAWAAADAAAQAKMRMTLEALQPMFASRVDFAKTPHGRTLDVPQATHYLFITNREVVLRHTREFLTEGQTVR